MSNLPLSTQQEIQAAYSDQQIASSYVETRFQNELNRLLHERQVSVVNQVLLNLRPPETLEVAPGPGRVTRDVRPIGNLTCLEFNQNMIDEGRRACGKHVEFMQGNAFELPFERARFDFVYTYRFIRHFQHDDRQRLYDQIKNVLKPGGTLVFDCVNAIESQPLRDANPQSYPVYDVLYRRHEMIEELTEAGFSNIDLQAVQKNYHWQFRSETLIAPRWRALNRLVVRTLERLPAWGNLEWIVTCCRE